MYVCTNSTLKRQNIPLRVWITASSSLQFDLIRSTLILSNPEGEVRIWLEGDTFYPTPA